MSYLILHKVRGEPAFDIAEKIQIGDEEGWIIPTSGHRAYPLAAMSFTCLNYATIGIMQEQLGSADWDSLPDHYQTTAAPKIKLDVRSLLSAVRPVFNFKRRI